MSTDDGTTLQHLRDLVATFVHERDWEQFHNPKDLAAAIAIEAAERQELFCGWAQKPPRTLSVLHDAAHLARFLSASHVWQFESDR